jgi:CRP-like cAMP-binding protein
MMTETAQFIRSLSFFDGLSIEDVQQLNQSAQIRTYPKKTSLYIYGDSATRFFIVMSGWVKLCQNTHDGNAAILGLFMRGDSFGEAVLIEGASYPQNSETIEETKVIELPAALLRAMARQNPEFSFHLMQSMTHNLHRLQLENEHLSVMTTTQRVACFILQLCLGHDHCDGHLTFPYDKHLAAARLGMKPETFSRGLKELRAYGVTVEKNDIFVSDQKALENFACSNCSACPENCPLVKKGLCCQEQNGQLKVL